LRTLEFENQSLKEEADILKQYLASVTTEKDQILVSRSWRVTRPLRVISLYLSTQINTTNAAIRDRVKSIHKFINRNDLLKQMVHDSFNRFPKLKHYLRMYAYPESIQQNRVVETIFSKKNLDCLPKQSHKILMDIQNTLEKHENRN
jgi:hypothetical protein